MNPISFALRRPVSVIVGMVAIIGAGAFSFDRMKVDIFPALNLPVIYVCQPYGGMDPQQMEGLIANYYEYHFLYINGIEHVESKNCQGVSLMKLFFHPKTDMAQAMAETVGYVNRARAFMPPGTVNPFIMRFDTGSVPVGYLVLRSDTKTIGQIQDEALFKVRPMFAAIPGVSAPPPFGGAQRTIVARADPSRLKACQLSADQVVQALSAGNNISPSGNVRTTDTMPVIPVNSMVVKPEELGDIEVKKGVLLRDVVRRDPVTDKPLIEDANDIPTGYALVNGRRAVYILVTKRADASTVDVVSNVRANLQKMQDVLPKDIKVSFEFDQSPYVTNAMKGVAFEGLLAAGLVGLMVFLFLRDWRTVIVVVLNIPLALLASVIALSLAGHTVNLMTLGGLALAVGILIDEATVAVENIHTQMERTPSVALAVWRGISETQVPRLLAMFCILAVFIPSFVMEGSARALFVPLALAVGFAMIASYLLSSTLVPVLSVWLLKRTNHRDTETQKNKAEGQSSLLRSARRLCDSVVRLRLFIVPAYLAVTGLLIWLVGFDLGREIFPQIDAGQFQFRLKAPTGTRIEQTEAITQEALEFIKKEVGPENVEITLGYLGVVHSAYPINSVYLWMGGPEESVMRVALKKGSVRIEDLKRRLREKLPAHLTEWTAKKWKDEGIPAARAEERARQIRLSFEPADIVNEVMSFGSPTPVYVEVNGVALSGPNAPEHRAYANKLFAELGKVRSLRDLQYVQSLDYPTFEVNISRQKGAFSDVTAEALAKAITPYTSSSRFTVPNFWRDPGSGIGYQVQVEVPQVLVKSMSDLRTVPVQGKSGEFRLLEEVADIKEGTMPGEIHRYNMRRLVSMSANIAGEDLGRVSRHLDDAVKSIGKLPAGVQLAVRGQVTPMNEIFRGLARGLGIAVVVIFLMLMAYYQSVRLALVAIAPVPAVVTGVALMLFLTGTTLNLQSFMGAIMALGVATANAILLVTFAERAREQGMSSADAGIHGAKSRTRAILMTSFAMIAGMLPMALGLGEGGDQVAPLGRAVIGGLAAGTLTTLFILPGVFALLMGKSSTASVSLDPFDPASRHYVRE